MNGRTLVVPSSLAAAAAALWLACSIYDSSLVAPPSADASSDAAPAPDASPDALDTCNHARIPSRPAADDDGGTDAGEIVLALKDLVLDVDAGNGETIGYDLDQTCTCPGPRSCTSPKADCDDPRGRDNSAGALLDSFSSYATVFDPTVIQQRFRDGRIGLLFRIDGYNGTPNDTQITVSIFLSNGTEGAEDGGTPIPPAYDGGDMWTVDPKSLVGGVAPPYIPQPDSSDTTAYVRDGVLVAAVSQGHLDFAGGGAASIHLDLTDVLVTGTLGLDANGEWSVTNGVLAGRWATRQFLVALAGIHDPFSTGGYLCGDSGTYATIKGIICDGRDITSSTINDNTNATCNALSIGLGFTATTAQFGTVYEGLPLLIPCGAQWSDECQ